jgi:outer membrane receptor protein involved in Fe transport
MPEKTFPRRGAAARRLLIPVCATLVAALPVSASAEAEPDTPAVAPAAPAAEEAAVAAPVTTLPPLIVTARRVPESPVEVPAYAQVITRAQIRESGAATLIDLLEREANLHFTSIAGSPTNTKVSLRGTGTGGNGRTLVLVDGVRANRADIGDFNWLQFSLPDIESIEVVQGPQGAFFGDNAVGGVIKINTLGKPSASGGSAQVLVGGDDTVKLGASYTELFGRAWASASLGHENSGGWRDHSGYDSVSGSVGIGYDNEKDSVTRVRASFLDNSYDQPGYLTPAQFQQDPTQAGTNSATGESSYRRVTASNEFGASAETRLLTDLGASFVDEYFLGGFGTAFDRDIQGIFVSPKLHLERGPFTLTPGLDFNHERLAVDVNGLPPTRARLTRRTVGPFLAAEWKATEQVAVSGAVRREWNSIRAREQISGARADRTDAGEAYQLAVNWRPRPELRLYAKYDHVFRFPATDEMAYYQGLLGGPFGTPVFFNANLRPEVSDNFELGGDYCGERWGGGASVYHLATEDEIFYNAPTNLNENLAETRRVGAQASLGYDAGFAALRSRVDYVDARLTDAPAGSGLFTGPLRMTPEWRLTTTATLRPVERVEIGLTHRFIDGSAIDDSYAAANPDRTEAASLFDVRVSYRPNEAWRLFAGANNVLDKNHVSYSTIGYPPPFFPPTTVVYPGQGRWLYAGASLRF